MDTFTVKSAKLISGVSYLGGTNTSSKIKKNLKVNTLTYILYLSPAHTSGYDVCEYATLECRLGCLATSGRAKMGIIANKDTIGKARIKKTELFFEQRTLFFTWLIHEINLKSLYANKKGYLFNVRLNGTSDIDWQNELHNGLNIFDTFPDIQFYDYTKNPNKFLNKSSNYHLTFSYTGRNWGHCTQILDNGNNIAVVFDSKNYPAMFKGYKVIDGDITDNRIDDIAGCIVALKFKHIANKANEAKVLNSVFVVKT